jgi:hypothetical protein
MNILERLFHDKNISLFRFLTIITIIQFWWIAIWGLAYIAIGAIAGKSKEIEILIYVSMLLAVLFFVQLNPSVIEKF